MAKDMASRPTTADLNKQFASRPKHMFMTGTGNKSEQNASTLMSRRNSKQIKSAPLMQTK